MPSHKSNKRRGSVSGARAAQRVAPTLSGSGATKAGGGRATTTRVAARPMSDSGTTTASAASTARAKAANGAGGAVVRRAAVSQAGHRSRMNRAARLRRQRSIIAGTVVGVLLVAGLGILLWNQLPFFHAQASARPSCTTNAQIGLSGTPAAAGGPPCVTGQVATLAQGLQYIDVKTGSGLAVKAGDTVTVNYTGWLTNGTKFDSSLNPGRTPFQVVNVGQAQVIQGWNIGLIGMKVGGERRLIIPPALGYGAQGYPPTIPPNATLIFDVTIVQIG